MWHHLTVTATGPETTASGRVDAASPWFDGHFPEMPVLPGIAQLAMVKAVIESAVERPVTVSAIRRIRFKRKIAPGEALTVVVSPMAAAGDFAFRILAGDDVACTGNMTIGAGRANAAG